MDYNAIYQMVLLREKLAGPKLHGYSPLPSILAKVDLELKEMDDNAKVDVAAFHKAEAEAVAKAKADADKAKAEIEAAKAKIDEDAAKAKAKAEADATAKAEKATAKPERSSR